MSWPQKGKEKISKATLRPCYSLNDEGFEQDQNNLNNVKSSSLGEIVVSFELSPSYLPREKLGGETEAFDESFVASKIVPMLANVRINRNRSYSANDVFEEEVEWAVETTNPTRTDSMKSLAAEKGNAERMEQYQLAGEESTKRKNNRPVHCHNGETGMSRRRCYSASESDTKPTNHSNLKLTSKSTTRSVENVFFPAKETLPSYMPKPPNGFPRKLAHRSPQNSTQRMATYPRLIRGCPNGRMEIQNEKKKSPQGVMRKVPDGESNTPTNSTQMLEILRTMGPASPVGLVLIPKGMDKPPTKVVKIPFERANFPPGSIRNPVNQIKPTNDSVMSPHSSGKRAQGLVVGPAQDTIKTIQEGKVNASHLPLKNPIPDKDLNPNCSWKIPRRPETPRPQKPMLQRRHKRLPPLKIQTALADSNSENQKGFKPPADEKECSVFSNVGQRVDDIRQRIKQNASPCSPLSPKNQKFLLRISLEELPEGGQEEN